MTAENQPPQERPASREDAAPREKEQLSGGSLLAAFAFVRDNKGKIAAAAATLLGGGGGFWYFQPTISIDVDNKASDLARYGEVTVPLACAEFEKFSRRLNAYFAQRAAETGNRNPDFTIARSECEAILRRTQPSTPAPAN